MDGRCETSYNKADQKGDLTMYNVYCLTKKLNLLKIVFVLCICVCSFLSSNFVYFMA